MIEIKVGIIDLTDKGGNFIPMFTMYCDSVPRDGEFIQRKSKVHKIESVLYIIDDFTQKVSIHVIIHPAP